MATMANCPHCDHEFVISDDAEGGARATCPSCHASFALRDEPQRDDAEAPRTDNDVDAPAAADESEPADSVEGAAERIENWFRSADTVTDESEDGLRFSQYGLPVHQPQSEIGEPPPPLGNEPPTEVESAPPAQPTASWDDAEHMEQLLADLDVQPADELAPDAMETRDAKQYAAGVETSNDDATFEETPATMEERREFAGVEAGVDAMDAADADDEADDVSIVPGSRPRRRRSSLVRTAVGIVVTGVVGLAIGGYALLWMLGPRGDFLGVAQYLPSAMLPASLRDQPEQVAANTSADGVPSEAKGGTADEGMARTDGPAHEEVLPLDGGRAEVPASFEQAVEAARGGNAAGGDDRYAIPPAELGAMNPIPQPIAPARFEDPVAPPPLSAAAASHVLGARSYTSEQLSAALRAAQDAQPGLLSGDLNDPAVQRTKGLSYNRLCDLAEVVTFAADPPAMDGASELSNRAADTAEVLFRETLRDPRIRGEVARIAPIWIETSQRRHGGIFFAGAVASSSNQGPVVECRIDTGAGDPLTILVPTALADQLDRSGGTLGIVGSIVDNPRERVTGYTGNAPQAIWVGKLIPLD